MWKFFSRFINKSVLQSYYFKMLLLYSTFTIVIVITSTFILLNYSNRNLENEIYKSNKRLLTQVQIYADKYLIETIHSLINEKFLDVSHDKIIGDFFNYHYSYNLNEFSKLHQNIYSTMVNNNFIDSIYCYRQTDDLLISTREGINFNVSSSENKYRDLINIDLIKETMTSSSNRNWISPLENMQFSKDTPLISFVQALPLYSTPNNRTGCVIFNINQQIFFDSINKIFDTNSGNLIVMDLQGKIFAHSDTTKLFNNIINIKEIRPNDLKTILMQDEGFLTASIDNKNFAVSWVKSSVNNWKYISIVPTEILNKDIFIVRQFALLVMGFIMILSLMGINLITSRLYKPINALIMSAKDQVNMVQDNKNELAFINQVISNLSSRVNEMEDVLHENEGVIEYKLCVDLLYGNIKNTKELKNRLQLINKDFIYPNYAVILIEINKNLLYQLPTEQKEFVIYKMIKLINEHLERNNICISVCYPSDCITAIVNFEHYEAVVHSLKPLMEILESDLGLRYNIGVSDPTSDIFILDKLYTCTNRFLKYSFIYEYGHIFTQKMVEAFESNTGDFNLDTLNYFETLLNSCKSEVLKNEITAIILRIKQEGYSYKSTQHILLQIISLVSRVSRKQKITTDQLDKRRLMMEFNNISCLDECVQWLYNLIDIYTESISLRNTAIDHEFITKITLYVLNNIDQQISLNIVAKEFNISASHLSRIFKEGTGMGFSEFVKNKKIEKAAELILSNKNTEISEIAEKLGYLTLSYFSRLFKEKYGMTPLQYRKNNK